MVYPIQIYELDWTIFVFCKETDWVILRIQNSIVCSFVVFTYKITIHNCNSYSNELPFNCSGLVNVFAVPDLVLGRGSIRDLKPFSRLQHWLNYLGGDVGISNVDKSASVISSWCSSCVERNTSSSVDVGNSGLVPCLVWLNLRLTAFTAGSQGCDYLSG